jgi:hypothetical protein
MVITQAKAQLEARLNAINQLDYRVASYRITPQKRSRTIIK